MPRLHPHPRDIKTPTSANSTIAIGEHYAQATQTVPLFAILGKDTDYETKHSSLILYLVNKVPRNCGGDQCSRLYDIVLLISFILLWGARASGGGVPGRVRLIKTSIPY